MAEMTLGHASAQERGRGGTWTSALPGTLFAVAFVAAMVVATPPSSDDPDKTWIDYFASRGNRISLLLSGYLLVAAGMLVMVFFSRLHARVVASGADRGNPLALLAGTAGGTLVALTGLVQAAIPGATIFGPLAPSKDADLLRYSIVLSYPIAFVGAMIAIGIAILAVTRAAQRSGFFGRAMSVGGYVAAVAGVLAVMFFPAVIVLGWVVAASVVLARRPALTSEAAERRGRSA